MLGFIFLLKLMPEFKTGTRQNQLDFKSSSVKTKKAIILGFSHINNGCLWRFSTAEEESDFRRIRAIKPRMDLLRHRFYTRLG